MMNQDDRLKPQSSAYAFIALEAVSNRFAVVLNRYFKEIEKDAMIIPMNIRQDDIYYTLSNMKKSKLDGAVISQEYYKDILELLDSKSELVNSCNLCDIILLKDNKFYGDFIAPKAMILFLKESGAKKIAVMGANEFAKALAESNNELEFCFYDEFIEDYLTLNMQEFDINRIENNLDLSHYDAVVNLSDMSDLSMIDNLAKFNLDMKKERSTLKARAEQLSATYYGYDELLDLLTKEANSFFTSNKN